MSKKSGYTQTTEYDYNLFRNEVLYWIGKLGLLDWEVIFDWKGMNGIIARMEYDVISRGACASLSKSIPDIEYNKFAIMKTAFHEACELLLSDMNSFMATDANEHIPKHIRDKDESEIHKIIRVMENVTFIDDVILRFKINVDITSPIDIANIIEEKLNKQGEQL